MNKKFILKKLPNAKKKKLFTPKKKCYKNLV